MNEKIFCIGLSRTGTTSLNKALSILGYKSIHQPGFTYLPHFFFQLRAKYLDHYDAFSDISVIPFYKKLEKQFDDAKFIYTIRNKEKWLKSCKNYERFSWPLHQVPVKVIALRMKIYNSIKFDYEKFAETFDRHHEDVMNYFANKRNKLLVINIQEGNQWEKLSRFLNKPIPEQPFPHMNKSKSVSKIYKNGKYTGNQISVNSRIIKP